MCKHKSMYNQVKSVKQNVIGFPDEQTTTTNADKDLTQSISPDKVVW